ncbi:MAG TPA: class D beta-lactamase [Lentimicrobium sp.]|nr:class D beta-lactamase [Lentimicrobium sp.]
MRSVLFTPILLLLFTCSVNKPVKRETPSFNRILDSFKLKGSILVYDHNNRIYYSNDFKWAEEGNLPASTFKIPNSIIALETGVIKDDSTMTKWDGQPRRLKVWEQDLQFKDAFSVSCVPCYQEIAREIGTERMNSWLSKLSYPGMVVNDSTIDHFWLEGNSRISQMQQVDFLERFYFSRLPISERSTTIVKQIMQVEKTDTYVLSGKTGWGIRNGGNNAWFVGYLETQDNVYFFATNVIPSEGFDLANFTTARMEVTKAALKDQGWLD